MWKLRAQLRKSVQQEHVAFFRHECRNIAEANALLRNRETLARQATLRRRNRRRYFHAHENHFHAVHRQAAAEHGFLDEIRYRDDAAGRAISRQGK